MKQKEQSAGELEPYIEVNYRIPLPLKLIRANKKKTPQEHQYERQPWCLR